MALIIKGEMPKGKCWWHDEQGKEHECQFFPCNAIYCLDPKDRKEMCLIIGEIPNKHGRLIDADVLKATLRIGLANASAFLNGQYKELANKLTDDICLDIDDAPTVLEATNDD